MKILFFSLFIIIPLPSFAFPNGLQLGVFIYTETTIDFTDTIIPVGATDIIDVYSFPFGENVGGYQSPCYFDPVFHAEECMVYNGSGGTVYYANDDVDGYFANPVFTYVGAIFGAWDRCQQPLEITTPSCYRHRGSLSFFCTWTPVTKNNVLYSNFSVYGGDSFLESYIVGGFVEAIVMGIVDGKVYDSIGGYLEPYISSVWDNDVNHNLHFVDGLSYRVKFDKKRSVPFLFDVFEGADFSYWESYDPCSSSGSGGLGGGIKVNTALQNRGHRMGGSGFYEKKY